MKTYIAAFLCVVFLGFTFRAALWAGTNTTRTSYYCQQCGMRRLNVEKDWLSRTYQSSDQLFPTGYSKLYFRGVAASCPHHWHFTGSQSSGSILSGGEIGCGSSSYALRYAPIFDRLRFLENSKIPAVLAAMPLNDPISTKTRARMDEITGALMDMEPNPTRQQTEKWWKQHHTLFGV